MNCASCKFTWLKLQSEPVIPGVVNKKFYGVSDIPSKFECIVIGLSRKSDELVICEGRVQYALIASRLQNRITLVALALSPRWLQYVMCVGLQTVLDIKYKSS